MRIFGGLDGARLVHRVSGFLFAALTFFHLAAAILSTLQHRMKMTLVPDRQDFKDAVQQLRYYLGLGERGGRASTASTTGRSSSTGVSSSAASS